MLVDFIVPLKQLLLLQSALIVALVDKWTTPV